MARKNNLRAEASSSAIHFDASTRTVMAEATHENIKEKVLAVREVVPGKSNNEVILVLQYYDYSVERTIQAYLEDGAKEALQEWNFTGTKQPNKKRKNKKKGGSGAGGGGNGEKTDPVSSSSSTTTATPSAADSSKAEGPVNGESDHLPNGDLSHDDPQASIATRSTPTQGDREQSGAAPQPQRQPHSKGRGASDKSGHTSQHHHSSHTHHPDPRERTVSEMSTGSAAGDGASKRPFHGLEKAIKDLHRQTTSLERLRNLLDHEIDRSYRSVKSVFEELRQGLSTREEQLCKEMDKLKREASEMLEMRQGKAADLRRQVDRAERMTEAEVSDLRAEVKHFVSERRHDEELGRTTRFLYDSDHLLAEIDKFGEVVHVKSADTARRASASSIASSVLSHDGNAELDPAMSQEVSELQDRLKNSLKLQTSSGSGGPSLENGSNESGFVSSKSSRRRPGNSQRGNVNRPKRVESSSPDADVEKLPSTASSPQAARSERHSQHHTTTGGSSNGPSGDSGSSPTVSHRGSPGRGGGRGRGARGAGGRGGSGGGSRGPRQQSSQGGARTERSGPAHAGAIAVGT